MRLLGTAVVVLIIVGAIVTLGVDGIIDLAVTGYEAVTTAIKNEFSNR